MGCAESKRRSEEIDAENSKAEGSSTEVIKFLLLGTAQAGKTTVYKQLRMIFGGGYPDQERRYYCDGVAATIISYISDLLDDNADQMRNGVQSTENEKQPFDTHRILDMPLAEETEKNDKLSQKDLETIIDMKRTYLPNSRLNNKELLNRIFKHFSGSNGEILLSKYDSINFQAIYCLRYFIGRIPDIVKPEYIPTPNDLMHMRIPTTGIAEVDIQYERTQFQVFDVGGERSERRKWIHYFEGVTAALFLVDISGYDTITEEGRNSLLESLEVFEDASQDSWLANVTMILLLNKYDLFRKKILETALTTCFPDYKGKSDVSETSGYISSKFDEIFRKYNGGEIHIYFTCATDSDMMKNIFESVFTEVR